MGQQNSNERTRHLAVDLDGTLVAGDTLIESLVALLFRRPWRVVALAPLLVRSRAAFKRAVAELAADAATLLPYREPVLDYIERWKAEGAALHLVTASDQSVADRVARHLGIFDSATGSDGQANLKGEVKARLLAARFPEGFGYIGDSSADRPVWRAARERVVVSRSDASSRRIMGEAGLPHETIRVKSMTVRDWIKALRLHHWTKNIVLFVPLFVSQEFDERANNAALALAFLAFGLLASAGYLVNDIRDVEADRAHPRKRKRAIASGRLSVGTALAFASLLTISGLTLAAFLPGGFIYYAIGYLAISLSYTMALKRQPMTDILVIGGLFTIRLAAGAAVLHLPLSLWLASFGLMLFCSLAFAKRTGGLAAAAAGGRTVAGSPYNPEDRFLLTVFGVACALVSVLVMVLYFQFKALATGLYDDIEWLYAIPIVLFSWLMRVWIFAFRGLLHEDPVVFALKDPLSWLHAVAVLAFWVIADKPGLGPL